MNKKLEAKLKTLPNTPGVYFHKDATGEVIYVGKAANLKNRVRSYFNRKHEDAKTRALVAEVVDTDWIEVETELDALFFESEMVKRYMPRYNILLRDDKSHLYVRIDMKSERPVVSYTREPLDDGAEYFGPYYGGAPIKQAMRQLRWVFPYYTHAPDAQRRSRLEQQLGLEPVRLSSDDYKRGLKQLISVVKGNRVAILRELESEMKVASAAQEFERAAMLRNQIKNLRALQKQILFGDKEFLDISKDQALVELQELLGLESAPARIEGFDISHLSGTNVVASMVVFKNGAASRADYRKFKMKQQLNDDTANMREVITRRLNHLSDWGVPDVVIIDGGQAQLAAALDAYRDYKVVPCSRNIKFIGRNKSGDHGKNAKSQPILPRGDGGYTVISIAHDSHLVKLVTRIDEESHRFAISYHTTLRAKASRQSALDEIPGIGPKTKAKLLKKFGSVAKIKRADEKELTRLIGKEKTRLVRGHL
ncbi:MAG: excinuclease ABC subunit UvrC [Candidatus Nomurabacteria bacterium]|nr:excinuclease ABC subunit UvrC [Candidatus Nomurabacteria bacterium]